jgi:hypothetical protein
MAVNMIPGASLALRYQTGAGTGYDLLTWVAGFTATLTPDQLTLDIRCGPNVANVD